MIKSIVSLICGFFFVACKQNSDYKFWNISKFNMEDSALKDEEKIKLLYTSQGPYDGEKQDYYIHIVAVSQNTGDTVNILTSVNNGFVQEDSASVFNYFTLDHPGINIIEMSEEELSQLKNVSEADKRKPKKFSKVARDPLHDDIADNRYPTVVGFIGRKSN